MERFFAGVWMTFREKAGRKSRYPAVSSCCNIWRVISGLDMRLN